MKMVNLRRPPVGVNLQGASYFGGMADVNDHVARVAAAGGGGVDEPELTQFAREVVAMDPAPSLAWSAACGYEAGTLFALDPEDGSGDFTVTRAGTTAFTQTEDGYWKPAAANEPRFTYTGGVRGLLVEGAATNLVPSATAYLVISNITYTNGINDSPFTNLPSTRIIKSGTGTTRYGYQSCGTSPLLNSTTYVLSRYFKYDGFAFTTSIEVNSTNHWGGTNWIQLINIASTGVTLGTSTNCTAKVIQSVNGWYRVEVAITTGASALAAAPSYLMRFPSTTPDGCSMLTVAPQLELSSTASSYVLTAGSAQTRNADVETVNVPAGVTQIILTNMNDVETIVTSFSSPYQIPVGTWKSIIMK